MLGAPFRSSPIWRCVLSDSHDSGRPRPPWLLLAGAVIGLGLASLGLLENRVDPALLPSDAAATVGERTIRRVDYERVLAGVAGDLRSPVDDAMRRRVLDRMIDEELLVQRALDLGLAGIDRRVRGELTSSMIASIVSETEGESVSERDIEKHYDENIDFFARPGRLRARAIYFSTRGDDGADPRGTAAERAAQARTRLLAGDNPSDVESQLGDRQVSAVPDTLLPPSKVRDYVGPSLLRVLLELETGAWSEVIENGGGLYLASTTDREPSIVPTLEKIASLVRQDLVRRRGDDALRGYLDDLRGATPVQVDEALFEQADAAK